MIKLGFKIGDKFLIFQTSNKNGFGNVMEIDLNRLFSKMLVTSNKEKINENFINSSRVI